MSQALFWDIDFVVRLWRIVGERLAPGGLNKS
jgi:hypothetical protein